MKKIFSSYATILVIALALTHIFDICSVQAMTNEQFKEKVKLYQDRKITPQEFYAACEQILAGADPDINRLGVLNALVNAHTKNNDCDGGHRGADKIIEEFPDASAGLEAHALSFMCEGKFPAAKKNFEAAMQKNPTDNPYIKEYFTISIERMDALQKPFTPFALRETFAENTLLANETLVEQEVAVRGNIATITMNEAGLAVITFQADRYGLSKIICEITPGYKSLARKVKKDQEIFITGRCAGLNGQDVLISKCWIIIK